MESAIRRWYPGKVISVRDFNPNKRVLDEEIPRYLLQVRQPTPVTINYSDFPPGQYLHPSYCLIRLKLSQTEALIVPPVLRSILAEPAFNTKAKRMGKVISWTKTGGIETLEF